MATLPKSPPKPKAHTPDPSRKKLSRNATESFSASEAKTHLLQLLDSVDRDRKSITITKRGRPIATLVPIEYQPARGIFGYMKGSGTITGDVVGPEPDIWNAMVE